MKARGNYVLRALHRFEVNACMYSGYVSIVDTMPQTDSDCGWTNLNFSQTEAFSATDNKHLKPCITCGIVLEMKIIVIILLNIQITKVDNMSHIGR